MGRRSLVATLLLLLARSFLVLGNEPIQIVFAGFPRSGTKSLSQALSRLGYKTCHGTDLMSSRRLLEAFADDRIDDALRLTEEENCNATFEFHGWYWREIRQKRPHAKFLVVIRDYECWESSMQNALSSCQPMLRYPLRLLPVFDLASRVIIAFAEHGLSDGSDYIGPDYGASYMTQPTSQTFIKDRKRAYDQFVIDVLEFVKAEPERALLFKLNEGYAPLCDFLGIPVGECPDEDFPHVNSGIELTMTIAVLVLVELSLYVVPLLVIFVVRKW